ncbi:MAG: DUF5320 domain-containing protein [Halobacteriota archaeon]|nr:DUF5320 domain-containing protein [Halobacteriota archaeon]
MSTIKLARDFDMTGPEGKGPMTGRGMGYRIGKKENKAKKYALGGAGGLIALALLAKMRKGKGFESMLNRMGKINKAHINRGMMGKVRLP